MAKITEFIVGACTHPECAVIKGGRFAKREFPARAYLLESGGERILWDTGYSRHFLEQTRGIYRLYGMVTPGVALTPAQGLRAQLDRLGVTPNQLTALVVSHFHADHVAGIADFPGVPVFAAEAAWESIKGVTGLRALLQGHIPALVPYWATAQPRKVENLPLVALPPELPGFLVGHALTKDQKVIAVSLPGHARGHLGAFVQTNAGWELIASDAAWDHRAYRELRGPRELTFLVHDNRADYYGTLSRLQQLHQAGVRIRLSHEPRPTAEGGHPA